MVLALTPDELAWALLEDMQARLSDPIAGMANREHLAGSLHPFGFQPNPQQHDVINRLNRAGRNALALLERRELIEPADDMNGRNGYVVLTPKGKGTTERTDFERVRVRGLLKAEMLHPLLRGKPYGDFTADHLDAAVLEAFKTVEIEVRAAAQRPKRTRKRSDVSRFAVDGPLSKSGETNRNAKRSLASSPARLPVSGTRRTHAAHLRRRVGGDGRDDGGEPPPGASSTSGGRPARIAAQGPENAAFAAGPLAVRLNMALKGSIMYL